MLFSLFPAQVTGFQRLSNMCEVDIDIFCDGDRQHMKEGIVLVVREKNTTYLCELILKS